MTVRTVAVEDGYLEIDDRGSGEPILFVQTALTADHLATLASQLALDRNHRRLLYHRRGYAGSSPACAASSIASDAADARELLTALGIECAHVVGASFSAAIALQFAADAPERVPSLVLVEAPPVHTSHAPAFRDANEELLRIRREHGVDAALDVFLGRLIGPDWRRTIEADLPGAVVQIERDAATFFDHDTPALLEWHFGPAEAGRVAVVSGARRFAMRSCYGSMAVSMAPSGNEPVMTVPRPQTAHPPRNPSAPLHPGWPAATTTTTGPSHSMTSC